MENRLASSETFKLEIASMTEHVVDTMVSIASFPGVDGEFGVLKSHTHFISLLSAGIIEFDEGGMPRYILISGGYAEVLPESVYVLADEIIKVKESDFSLIAEEKLKLERILDAKPADDPEISKIKKELDIIDLKIRYISISS